MKQLRVLPKKLIQHLTKTVLPTSPPPILSTQPTDQTETAESLPEIEKRGKKFFLLGIIILIVIFTLTGAVVLIKIKNTSQGNFTQEIKITTKDTTDISDSKTDQIIKSDWTFEVLNGSGTSGAAKKMADQLIGLGYTVIKTGNADQNNYPITMLYVAQNMTEKQDLLLEDLKITLNIATIAGTFTDSTSSARIIVGRK